MDRRYILKGLGAGAIGMSLSSSASSAKTCKIIGIGGAAGSFFQDSVLSGAIPANSKWVPEFTCVDYDLKALSYINADKAAIPGSPPVTSMPLTSQPSKASVDQSRLTFRSQDALRAMLADTKLVVLVAGLGGRTGSGVTPLMAKLVREAGALTVAAVFTPFQFEGVKRSQKARKAISHLYREADLVVQFSNQKLMDLTGDTITQDNFFSIQNERVAMLLRNLMDG